MATRRRTIYPLALSAGRRPRGPCGGYLGGALPARATAERSEDGAHEHSRDRAAEHVIPGEHVSEPVREPQHPLAHGDDGEHMIHQMRGALGDAPPAAVRHCLSLNEVTPCIACLSRCPSCASSHRFFLSA
jgi:hypothetical protein